MKLYKSCLQLQAEIPCTQTATERNKRNIFIKEYHANSDKYLTKRFVRLDQQGFKFDKNKYKSLKLDIFFFSF